MSEWSQWVETQPVDRCLLKALVAETNRVRTGLTRLGPHQLQQLIAAGITLRRQWPRPWGKVLEICIGGRLYLLHAANVASSRGLTAVVSSALGRGKQQLRAWPLLLDHALQHIARQNQRLLLVPGTTTYTEAAEFARRARLSCLHAIVDDLDQTSRDRRAIDESRLPDEFLQHESPWDVDGWLVRNLETAQATQDKLLVSPMLFQHRVPSALPDPSSLSTVGTEPQDRIQEWKLQAWMRVPLQGSSGNPAERPRHGPSHSTWWHGSPLTERTLGCTRVSAG